MKQLKFLKTITCDGRPVWYKDCCYEVVSEGASSQGREMYKLFCEDLKLRGIDTNLTDSFYTIIEIQDEKKVIEEEVKQDEKKVEEKSEIKKEEKVVSTPKTNTQKKKKTYKN